MGVLKGRFQCLRGLRVKINNHKDHHEAMQWISVAIILHNLIIEIDGVEDIHEEWEGSNGRADGEHGDDGPTEDDDPAVSKRNQLIGELLWARYHE
jgi:hypothetical protein